MEKLRVASLFCGCGGTDVGLLGDFDFLGKHYDSNSMQMILMIMPAIFLRRILKLRRIAGI